MKLVHEGEYSRAERENFKEAIFTNAVQSMQVILEAMISLDIGHDGLDEAHVETIEKQPAPVDADILPVDIGDAIAALWKDGSVRECFRRSNEYQLNDSAK
jgi:guanine nucleotide-binding protein G(i) subunit alpha